MDVKAELALCLTGACMAKWTPENALSRLQAELENVEAKVEVSHEEQARLASPGLLPEILFFYIKGISVFLLTVCPHRDKRKVTPGHLSPCHPVKGQLPKLVPACARKGRSVTDKEGKRESFPLLLSKLEKGALLVT